MKKYLLMFLFGVIVLSGELIERHYVSSGSTNYTILIVKTGDTYKCEKLLGLFYIPIGSTIKVETADFWESSPEYKNGYKITLEEK